MPITAWKPNTAVSRGNIKVGITPTMVDYLAPKLSELTAGSTGLECSIQTMNGTSSADSETVDWLCDPASEQIPGSITHDVDDLVIKGSGQSTDSTLLTALPTGVISYLWRIDGKPVATAPAVGDMIWVWKIIITSIDPLEANNTFIGYTVHFTVLGRTPKPIALVA